ncbi:uncharacterized protein ASPGLDRAFT_31538 [Aspergillus glaucus CBS 516.65]|uniref:BZIP domain-containing protein n=1 Tax=Aspergillus glaucus CBS 516.65 TaxID=1160497 RepID=A0A1L9VWX1_ASPGL|nr:hypothetical protein ASPGLDRAFT_31538 [Aspergillus glaucus CBS 516.65]OJJ88387.1 hypothetical protein ASPGLDRAFT_31538 [Aspergillus glaucus CBS 516.65]
MAMEIEKAEVTEVEKAAESQDLARIRNNQQRCRQRRRDYVTELEQRIAEYEDSFERKVAMLQASIDELRRENERLRGLVGDGGASGEGRGAKEGIGSSNTTVVTATAAGIGAKDETNVAIPDKSSRLIPVGDVGSSLDGPVGGTCTGTESPAGPEPTLLQSSKSLPDFIGNQLDGLDMSQLPFQWNTSIPPSPSSVLRSISTDLATPSLNDYLPNTLGESTYCTQPDWLQWLSTTPTDIEPTNTVQETDTTLCTAAFGLVMRCNKQNASIGEIEAKLRCGYRSAVFQWEGCRVENRVLLAVLSEIA